jgi:NitT/TauT family transport system substrate-binding protein
VRSSISRAGRAQARRQQAVCTRHFRATDICAAKSDWVDRDFTPRYDYARQGWTTFSYRAWHEYDAEDAVRFWALRYASSA